jgi:hypothetical protein
VRAEADTLLALAEQAPNASVRSRHRNGCVVKVDAFLTELKQQRVLDPACGSGNFLYVALSGLLDLEKEVRLYRATAAIAPLGFPEISPRQVLGVEINEYAQELAQVAIWIGYLQWMIQSGFSFSEPVLDDLETIRLLDEAGGRMSEAIWPAADFIIGNPPFLGGKRLRDELGDEYVDTLFSVYAGQVARESDFVCYFFEKARAQIDHDEAERAGLLATNSIRGGANREVVKRIKQTGDIYMAWDDEPWVLDGAAVRISIVGFDDGTDDCKVLDGGPVAAINSDLTSAVDITSAVVLRENAGLSFQGPSPKAPFDIPAEVAQPMLDQPLNVNGRPNGDVVRPLVGAIDIARRSRGMYTIDFAEREEDEASYFEAPFEHVRRTVLPIRMDGRRDDFRGRW